MDIQENEHISFGDLTVFVWMDALTPETKALALRVNQHLVTCAQCRQKAAQLERVQQEAEAIRRQARARSRGQDAMGKVIPFPTLGKMPPSPADPKQKAKKED